MVNQLTVHHQQQPKVNFPFNLITPVDQLTIISSHVQNNQIVNSLLL